MSRKASKVSLALTSDNFSEFGDVTMAGDSTESSKRAKSDFVNNVIIIHPWKGFGSEQEIEVTSSEVAQKLRISLK